MTKLSKADQLALHIGRVTIEWNNVQFWFFILFKTLLHNATYTAHSIFFSIRSDRSQRERVKNLAIQELENHATYLKELNKLIKTANQLGGRRNDALHSMWEYGERGTKPRVYLPLNNRLYKKDAETEFAELLKQLRLLQDLLISLEKRIEKTLNEERRLETRKMLAEAFVKGLRPINEEQITRQRR